MASATTVSRSKERYMKYHYLIVNANVTKNLNVGIVNFSPWLQNTTTWTQIPSLVRLCDACVSNTLCYHVQGFCNNKSSECLGSRGAVELFT